MPRQKLKLGYDCFLQRSFQLSINTTFGDVTLKASLNNLKYTSESGVLLSRRCYEWQEGHPQVGN